jgi:hypothetical protein
MADAPAFVRDPTPITAAPTFVRDPAPVTKPPAFVRDPTPITTSAPDDSTDHGYGAETGKQFQEGLGKVTALKDRGKMGTLEGPLATAGAIGGAVQAAASPLTGAIRSFGGRAINAAERGLRAGGVALYGEDKVPKAPTFEQSANEAERLSMVAPVIGMAPKNPSPGVSAARNAMGVLEKIFSPETVDANAKAAVASIRELGGKAARDTEQTAAALEPAWKKVNAMPDADRLNFIDYVEGRSNKYAGLQMKDPALQDLADTMRAAFDKRMAKIQALPNHQQMAFVQDYYPHFWKDPNAATQATQSGAVGRQGSGASLKARTVPTIADGIAMGLEPITTNPLEATMRYVTSMDRFIASTEVLETAKNAGQVRYIRPQVMGASGHPNSFKVPPGWKPINGRGATDATGAQAYAPEGFARIYNNFISRGIAEHGEEYGTAYDAARSTSNAITALELGLSGYHALTMMQESMVNSLASAIGYARAGKPIEAVKSAGETAIAPVSYAFKGKKVQDIYLGLSQGSQEMQKITDLLTAAGGRAKGAEHAPDYNFSKTGSYWTALKRGALKLQYTADRAEARGANIRAFGEARFAAKQVGRIFSTVAQPIFEKYIPLIKNGAFYENMSQWLKAHPNATREEQITAARQVWDSIDNRFGEMVQDNIFVDKLLKQAGMLGMRSWSWTIGSGRELVGAARDVARAPFKTPAGSGPNEGRWTQKMDYAIALPVVYGTLAALYQGLKTGKPPESMRDLMAPRTGGVDATTGEPERLTMPGYMKDVFGFIEHPVTEITNKEATAPRAVGELITNKDWRGDPIFPPDPSVPEWLKAFWNYAGSTLGPISVRGLMQGQKEGSNLNKVETLLGVRTAPRYLTDPEGFDEMMKSMSESSWRRKERHDQQQKQLYEGN